MNARIEPEPRVVIPYRGGTVTAESRDAALRFLAELDRAAERAQATKDRWPGTNDEQMVKLASLFPSMRGVPGTNPWDPGRLLDWLDGPAPTSGSAAAARFLLGVWNGGHGLKRKFDLFEAFACWDEQHQAAALQWIELPFWP